MKKNKFIVLLLAAAIACLAPAACSNPSNGGETTTFTINLGGSGRAMAYPPSDPGFPDVSDLAYVVTFTPTSAGSPITIAKSPDSSNVIKGTIPAGVYNVTISIKLAADDTPYAAGGAVDSSNNPANPVTVIAGTNNTILVKVTQDSNFGEDGTPAKPFRVFDVATLKRVGTEPTGTGNWTLAASYSLMRNINMSGEAFTPIGTGYAPATTTFTGTFNGNEKTISNLNISGSDFLGLFGSVYGNGTTTGIIKNLSLKTVTITSTASPSESGGLVGNLESGLVKNCNVTGSVSGAIIIGGIVGNNNGVVEGCYFTGNVSCSGNSAGGIIGENVGVIEGCYFTGNVSCSGSGGGIAGNNCGLVKDCHAAGNITGTGVNPDTIGGVVGENEDGTVENSDYSEGTVSGNTNIGGVVGAVLATGGSPSIVRNCYSSGGVSGSGNYVGGVVGSNQGGTVENCYSSGGVSGANYVGGVAGYMEDGSDRSMVINCYSSGGVSGADFVGGVVGANNNRGLVASTVKNCYSTGDVSGQNVVGGVVGLNDSSGLVESTVENCYATGTVEAGNDYAGGIVGLNDGANSTVVNCAALNSNLKGQYLTRYGRVVGYESSGVPTALTNNFGRTDMKLNGSTGTWTNNATNISDGGDISSTHWGNAAWWKNTIQGSGPAFDPAVWDFAAITPSNNKLPTLKNMPDGEQDPAVR